MSANSVPDTSLGLTGGELLILRQQQQVMQQRSHQGGYPGRGRDDHRSQPSSRHASAASSTGGPTRLVLDPRHLQALQTHMDNVLRSVANRIEELEEATQRSVDASSDRHGQTASNAQSQVERMRKILSEIDRMEDDFRKITHIKEVIKRLRTRVEETEVRIDRHNDRHSHHHHHGSSATSGRHTADRHRR